MNSKVQGLVKHLEQEIQWIEQLNVILTEEKQVLTTLRFDELEQIADNKQSITDKLEQSAKERMTLLFGDSSKKNEKLAMKEILSTCTAEEANTLNDLNNKLAENLLLCRELNTVNGQVIASNMHTRQEIVKALSGNKSEAVSVYNANGDLNSTADASHHQEA